MVSIFRPNEITTNGVVISEISENFLVFSGITNPELKSFSFICSPTSTFGCIFWKLDISIIYKIGSIAFKTNIFAFMREVFGQEIDTLFF